MPWVLAAAVLSGLAIGAVSRGRLSALARLRLKGLPLLLPAFAAGAIPSVVRLRLTIASLLIVGSYVLVASFIALNIRAHKHALKLGFSVLLVGWMLNAIPIALNGGMPLSLSAYAASGQREAPTFRRGGFFKIVVAGPSTRLKFLGDVIPIAPAKVVLSAGDIVLMSGIAVVIGAAMRVSGEDG